MVPMKKFKFSLETVLSYKQQVLDSLQREHGILVGQVRAQEELLQRLRREYREYSDEYNERTATTGLLLTDALYYQSRLRAMEREIQEEAQRLEELERKAEEKRLEVVAARQDTASIEKLREKKLSAYDKAVAKSEEQLVEEFVSTARVIAAGDRAG